MTQPLRLPRSPAPASSRKWTSGAVSLLVVCLVTACYGSYVRYRLHNDYHGNYSGFLQLSQDTFDGNPLVRDRPDIRRSLLLRGDNGYDGQFMYYMTFDPFMRRFDSYRTVVDYPPYRFGRIGFSLLTKLVSRDRWRQYPATMMGLVLVGIAIAAAAVCAMATGCGLSPAWGLIVVAIPGFWESLQVALPEPIAAGFLLASCYCLTKRWTVSAGLCLALSLLVRETGLVFVVCVVGWEFSKRRTGAAWRIALISVVPLALWRVYVAWSTYPMYGTEALFANPHDFGLPFGGVFDMWRAIERGDYYSWAPAVARAAIWYSLVMTGGVVLAVALSIRATSAASLAAVGYGLIAVSLNFESIWGGIGTGVRDTFELFVLLAVASLGWRQYSGALRMWIGCFWTAAALYVFAGAVEATSIRHAILAVLWTR
jgi:hypothetical protein